MENNLFTITAFEQLKDIGIEVTKKERIVYDKFVTLDGVVFDADDLYITLEEVDGGDVTTDFSCEKTTILKKYGILESEGSSRWMMSATLGPNGKEFIKMLEDKMFNEE